MRVDLERALHDVADSVHDDATADRMAGQVRHMVTRVRRRRAARHTAQGVVGVGAAAAVALTAGQLLDRDGIERGPVAGPSEPTDDFGTCGSTVDASSDAGWTVEGTFEADESGQVVAVTVRTDPDPWEPGVEHGEPTMVLARDGVVVSEPRTPDASAYDPPQFHVPVPRLACADGASLPPGEYEGYVRHEITRAGSKVDEAVVVGPWPIVVQEPTTDAGDGGDGAGDAVGDAEARIAEILAGRELADHFPFCGSEVPSPPDDPVLTASLLGPTGGAELASGERGEVSLELATGGGRHVLADTAPTGTLALLVDGVVVAYQSLDGEALARIDLSESDRVTLPVRWSATLCGPDGPLESGGIPVPPGEYEAVASVDVLLAEITEPDGRTRAGDGLPYTVVSEPVTVTVTG